MDLTPETFHDELLLSGAFAVDEEVDRQVEAIQASIIDGNNVTIDEITNVLTLDLLRIAYIGDIDKMEPLGILNKYELDAQKNNVS